MIFNPKQKTAANDKQFYPEDYSNSELTAAKADAQQADIGGVSVGSGMSGGSGIDNLTDGYSGRGHLSENRQAKSDLTEESVAAEDTR